MSHQTELIRYQIRAANVLIIKRGYPILFPLLGMWVLYPWLLWDSYRMNFSIDMLYGDSIYYAQILMPMVVLLCPLMILKDYTNKSCRELIYVYKRSCLGDIVLIEGYSGFMIAAVLGVLSVIVPEVRPEVIHMLAVSFLYNSLFYLLISLFGHVMMPFLLMGMYHFLGLSWMDSSEPMSEFICFLNREPISQRRCIICIGIGVLCLILGRVIETRGVTC